MVAAGIGLCTRVTQEYGPRFRTVSPNGIFIIYIPGARGIRRNITRNDDISGGHSPREISSLSVRFHQIHQTEGIQMLYYTKKILGLKKRKV
jgi:hypothetical protein